MASVARQRKLWLSEKKKKPSIIVVPASACLGHAKLMEEGVGGVGGMVWLAWPPGSEPSLSKALVKPFPSLYNPCEWGRPRLLPPARGTEVGEFHSEGRVASGSVRSTLTSGMKR